VAAFLPGLFLPGLEFENKVPHNLPMVVIPAIRNRFGQGFDSPHLHPSLFGTSGFGWGCTGFDRADEGEQATRQAIDVNEANL
jgi:hypothetical protein